MTYKILCKANAHDLMAAVQSEIDEGWELVGGVAAAACEGIWEYSQALIRKEKQW